SIPKELVIGSARSRHFGEQIGSTSEEIPMRHSPLIPNAVLALGALFIIACSDSSPTPAATTSGSTASGGSAGAGGAAGGATGGSSGGSTGGATGGTAGGSSTD